MTLSTTSPGDEREAFEAHIKTTSWYQVLSQAKDEDDDGASIFRMARMAAREAWDARASSSTVQQVGAEPLTAEQVVAQTTNYSMHEASIFFAGVIFAEEHHGIISPKSEQGDQQ